MSGETFPSVTPVQRLRVQNVMKGLTMLLDDTSGDETAEQNQTFLPRWAGLAHGDYRGEMAVMPGLFGTFVKEASHPAYYASGLCV